MHEAIKGKPQTLTDLLRLRLKGIAEPIAALLNNLGLKPNTITITGLIGHIIAAYLVAVGNFTWGGLLLALMAPVDFLDGTMARLRGESTSFGAFVDSVTDRYSEFVILGGLLLYYLQQSEPLPCILVYLAAAGSLLVSYIRAKAEALGYEVKVGLLTRVERYFVLIPALILKFPILGLWAIAILANVTAMQRILYIRHQAYDFIKRKEH